MKVLKIEANREGYSIDQVSETMTVKELIEFLQEFDEDSLVYLSHDRGFTFGGMTYDCFEEEVYDSEDDASDDE